MPLTVQEQSELDSLNSRAGVSTSLTQDEQVELDDLNARAAGPNVFAGNTDKEEVTTAAEDIWKMHLDLGIPLSEAERGYENLNQPLSPPSQPTSEFTTPPKFLSKVGIKNFFVGDGMDLPPNPSRIEKVDAGIKLLGQTPIRTFFKYANGKMFHIGDVAYAAIKRVMPEGMIAEEAKDMTLTEAVDWAMGYDPSGFSKAIGEIAEFAGGIQSANALGIKTKLVGGTPKGITATIKAAEAGKIYGINAAIAQITKAASTVINPTDTEYGFEGPKAVLRDMAVGAVFSYLGSGIKGVWSKLTPTEKLRALKLLKLKKGATPEQIRKAAQKEAFKYHPDKVKGMRDEFEAVIKARDLLKDGKAKDIIFRGQPVTIKPKFRPASVTEPVKAPVTSVKAKSPATPPVEPIKVKTPHIKPQEPPLTKVPSQEPALAGGKQAGATTIIPDIVTEVTETATRLGSTLSDIKGATKEVASRNIRRYTKHLESLGPEGKSISKDLNEVGQRAQKQINNTALDTEKILKGVNKANRERIAKYINGREANPPKWIKERGDKLRKALDVMLDEANKVGIKRTVGGKKVSLTKTGEAFPQVPNALGEKILKQAANKGMNSPEVIEVAQEAVKNGTANSVEEYVADLQRFRQDQLRGVSGYLERTRVPLPDRFIEWDPDRVLEGLIQKNWLSIEGIRQWGADVKGQPFPKLAVKSESLRGVTNADEANTLDTFIKASFGRGSQASAASQEISGAVRGYQFLSKIGLSPLTITKNMLDRAPKAIAMGPTSTLFKTLKEFPPIISAWIKHSREVEEEMIRRGAIFSNTSLGEGYQPGHLLTKVAGKIFSKSERGNQVFLAQMKKNSIDRDLKLLNSNSEISKVLDKRIGGIISVLETIGQSPRQAKNRLRELGNDELISKLTSADDIPPELLDAILHRTVKDTAFPVMLSTKRSWWDNKPFMRISAQFKTWGADQVGHVWNDVIKDSVQNRDPSKMVRWLVSMAIVGEIYNVARDFTLGKSESLTKNLTKEENRNLKAISSNIIKDILDGGAVGILADIVYGLPNLFGGPTLQTAKNVGDAVVKSTWNPSQTKDAIVQLAQKESAALKQAMALFDKVDAKFNEKNITQEYSIARTKGFEYAYDKKNPNATDKAKQKASQAILGWTKKVPTERTLSYEMAIRQILVGDTKDASKHLFFLLNRAGDDAEELASIESGIRSALDNASPLGLVAKRDVGDFLNKFSKETQRELINLETQYNANAAEAFSLAVRKWQKEQ